MFSVTKNNLVTCPKYLSLKIPERQETIKKKGLCFRCVSRGNFSSSCKVKCEVCQGNHHQTIYLIEKENPQRSGETNTNFGRTSRTTLNLLMTAKIKLRTKTGGWREARALLDGGSQSNFITENLVKGLDWQTTTTDIKVNGIASSVSQVLRKVRTNMKSCCGEYQKDITFLAALNWLKNFRQRKLI